MKLMNPIIIALAALFCTPVFAGDDVGAGFFPESGKEIQFSGQLNGKSLTCGKNKRALKSCQRKFKSLYNKASFSGTIRGYIREDGRARRNMLFTIGYVSIHGKDTRVIYEVDDRADGFDDGMNGIFWLEPMSVALR